ncbi:HNH endonuclease signature motif containing protein [Sedimentibacter sp.]|uniref:HNH endonuclease signature motif containing protein n=1 Tax=Sedimentibacter sp. TaxID=1960295 RepID=UPI0028B1CA9D|nr:HNH endonuclease signature motif containing protein [Sedimentibacter sp.]
MAKEFAKRFYDSKAWKDCRESFISDRISVDGGMCQYCGEDLGYIVDHIEELTPDNINNPYITLNHDNLQYLSLKCHNIKTFSMDKDIVREGLMFDCNGELIQSPHK